MAYNGPRFDPAEGLIEGFKAGSQAALDQARREEIAMKAASMYGGIQGAGQQNDIAFAQSPVGGPSAGYQTMDQNAANAQAKRLGPPPALPASPTLQAPPPTPAGVDTSALAPPPQGTPAAPAQLAQPPVPQGPMNQAPTEQPPLPPPSEEDLAAVNGTGMPEAPPTLDESKLEQFRSLVRQKAAMYPALTRSQLEAQGLPPQMVDELRGFGPISDATKNAMLQLGHAQLRNYATGTDTPDFKMNAQLEAQDAALGKQKVANQGRAGTWKQFKDDVYTALEQEVRTLENPMSGILDPASLAEAKRKRDLYIGAKTGVIKQVPQDPEDQALFLRARSAAELEKRLMGLGSGINPAPAAGVAPAAPPVKRFTWAEVAGRLGGKVKADALAAIKAGVDPDEVANSADVLAVMNMPKLRTK